MAGVKDIRLAAIPSKEANAFVRAHHYSGKVVNNSQLHLGAFLNGRLHGVMSFGPSTRKELLVGLVEGTGWNEFIELNRMAFDEALPRNSESRCLAVAMRLLRRNAPHLKWVVSFADGCSCGDGTIYRASGFVLTQIKRNASMLALPDGTKVHKLTLTAHPNAPRPELGGRTPNDLRKSRGGAASWPNTAGRPAPCPPLASCCATCTSSTRRAGRGSPCPRSPSRASRSWGPACTAVRRVLALAARTWCSSKHAGGPPRRRRCDTDPFRSIRHRGAAPAGAAPLRFRGPIMGPWDESTRRTCDLRIARKKPGRWAVPAA